LNNYGIEFQDLHLPVSVQVDEQPLKVIGACGLPDLGGKRELDLPLTQPVRASRLVMLTNLIAAGSLPLGQNIGEVVVEGKSGKTFSIPLRLGDEVMSWDGQCGVSAKCKTVFQWHKRLAIVGQNRYPGALRDFPAGLHGVVVNLPEVADVAR